MDTIDMYKYSFPVIGGDIRHDTQEPSMVLNQIYGTAFSIGSGFFLTAAHVINSVREHKWHGLGYSENKIWLSCVSTDFETIVDYDIGILKVQSIDCLEMDWDNNTLPMSQRVLTAGYPYSFDNHNMAINIRAFSGYIVSDPQFYSLPAKPSVYELQFPCPRGLSGAPLFTPGSSPKIVGMIIGNHSTEMLVYSQREIEEDSNNKSIVERYEALQLGIALQTNSVLDCHFELLGSTLGSHLKRSKLI
ncbi:MAG: serine protease [Candidatus Electrothrix sp. AR1]|nr:serine protease [Candidatus Electrothrix sp. AR1]